MHLHVTNLTRLLTSTLDSRCQFDDILSVLDTGQVWCIFTHRPDYIIGIGQVLKKVQGGQLLNLYKSNLAK